ncbi:hypothetical protein EK904_005391 [Melospiza melodia maxima]|nr:hypothetical protein EK904_005391 [Melospiza melodia maxima]
MNNFVPLSFFFLGVGAVPEQTKTSVSQPQPVTSNGTSPGTSTPNNAKRAPASSQQQPLPRYPPREVPPRFRHQEQKQLLKRGQQLPGIAANLGSTPKVFNGQPGGSTGTNNQPVTNGEVPNSSKKQPGLLSVLWFVQLWAVPAGARAVL